MAEPSKPVTATNENGAVFRQGGAHFPTQILPWLLGFMMLGVFILTLNHGIAAESIGLIAGLEGLMWTPRLASPITVLATAPLGWLPAAWIPLAANLFTAGCAALSLGWLARSVALLPHDLAKDAPAGRRGFEPPKLLESRAAWLPPLCAVLACGLQLSFWENAVAATGRMVELLLFAYVIRCFLEFNASGKDSWLLRAALTHGLAMANDWVMGMFIPALLVGLVWVKRFFNTSLRQLEHLVERRALKLELLWQLPACWLAGFALVVTLPLMAAASAHGHLAFWPALKITLKTYADLAHLPREFWITACLTAIMPVFLIGLRYYHFLSGASRAHLFLGLAFYELVYGFFLAVILWTLFDTPLSPRRQAPTVNTLPLYFLEALSLGYFIGHFLAAAEAPETAEERERRRAANREGRRRPPPALSLILKRGALAGVIVLAAGIPGALTYKNLREVEGGEGSFTSYFQEVERTLPSEGAVLIGADAARLAYLQADLARAGGPPRYLLMDIPALEGGTNYLDFLKRQKIPGFNLDVPLPDLSDPDKRRVLAMSLLKSLAKDHAIYCLPPAPVSDFLAELFYFEPRGLLYRVAPFSADDPFAPTLPPEVAAKNDAFWRDFRDGPFNGLVRRINPPQRPPAAGLVKRFVNTMRYSPEADRSAMLVGSYYAVALNDWGVALQRAGRVPAAGQCFADALQLDPRNAAAEINAEFNTNYAAGAEIPIQKALDTAASLNKYRDWHYVMEQGAVDEPNFCFMLGAFMADDRLYRPAIAQFERVRQLSPANLDTAVNLARLFVECHDLTNSLAAANDLLALSPTNETGLFVKANSEVRMEKFQEALPLLNQLLAENPTNNLARLNRAIANRGAYLPDAARRDYAAVIQAEPDAFPAYYDLAQMDDAIADTPAAITNYELFLKYAPPTVQEVPRAQARLKELQAQASGPPPDPAK